MKTIKLTILFLGITMSGFAQSKEEEAIKKVCEKETQSFNNRDADGMLSCHANKPYSLMLSLKVVLYITQDFAHYIEELSDLGAAIHNEGGNPFAPENITQFKELDARYDHEVFYERMPEHLAKYGAKS